MNIPHEIPELKDHADVSAERIAKVYAESLFSAAEKAGQLEEVLLEYRSLIIEVLPKDPRIEVLLSSAAIGRDARAEVIARTFKDRSSPTFHAFLQVLSAHDRLELLKPIGKSLRALYDEKANRVRVYVTTAVPMNDEEVAKIAEVIRHAMKLEPVMMPLVDPAILGGLKVRVGDLQYDASVKTRIENIRNQILTSSSHEIQSRRDRFSSAN